MARQRNIDESERFLLGPEKVELLSVAGPSTTQQLLASGGLGSSVRCPCVGFCSRELVRIRGELALVLQKGTNSERSRTSTLSW